MTLPVWTYNRLRFRAVMPTLAWNNGTQQDDPYWFISVYLPDSLKNTRNPTVGEVNAIGMYPTNAAARADTMAKSLESTILTGSWPEACEAKYSRRS